MCRRRGRSLQEKTSPPYHLELAEVRQGLLADRRMLTQLPFQRIPDPHFTMSSMKGLLGKYNSEIRNDINTAMGDLRRDVKEELLAIRPETRVEFVNVRAEAKITGDVARADLEKMEERLKN